MMRLLAAHAWEDWPGDVVLGLTVIVQEGDDGVLLTPTSVREMTQAQRGIYAAAKSFFPRMEISHFCGSWGRHRWDSIEQFEETRRAGQEYIDENKRSIRARGTS